MFQLVAKAFTTLLITLSLSGHPGIQAQAKVYTHEVHRELMLTAMHARDQKEGRSEHPVVGHTTWLSSLECTSCYSIYNILLGLADNYFDLEPDHKIMNGKMGKAVFHMWCFFYYDGETCMRYVQTYVDLTTEHIIRGVLNKYFFCGPIMKICPVFTFRAPL